MKRVIIATAFAALPLAALASDFETVDVNGDGVLSLTEVQAIWADVTEEGYASLDLNGDGAIDAEEYADAQERGLLAPTVDSSSTVE